MEKFYFIRVYIKVNCKTLERELKVKYKIHRQHFSTKMLYNISYHTIASGIRKNIALLRPLSNEAEDELDMGRRCAIFSV